MLSYSPQGNDYQGITDEGKYDSMKGKVTGLKEESREREGKAGWKRRSTNRYSTPKQLFYKNNS